MEAVLLKTSHTFKIQVIQLPILQLEPAYFQLLPYHQVLLSMIIKSIKLMCEKKVSCFHNMSYLTDSYISFTLKLESWQKFCFNSLIRSSKYGKKNISDFPPCGKMVVFVTEFAIFLKTSK